MYLLPLVTLCHVFIVDSLTSCLFQAQTTPSTVYFKYHQELLLLKDSTLASVICFILNPICWSKAKEMTITWLHCDKRRHRIWDALQPATTRGNPNSGDNVHYRPQLHHKHIHFKWSESINQCWAISGSFWCRRDVHWRPLVFSL